MLLITFSKSEMTSPETDRNYDNEQNNEMAE